MKTTVKLVSDDEQFEISADPSDLANLGVKAPTGIILKNTTGIECTDEMFIRFDQIDEIIAMLAKAQSTFRPA